MESIVGKGTKISITLPAYESDLYKKIDKKRNSPNTYTGRVLVMDDDDEVREALCNILEKLGMEIYPTAEGSEAVKQYQ